MDNNPTPKTETGIQRAVAFFGGQIALAARLGVTQQAVSSWEKAGYVPVHRAKQIGALTGIPATELVSSTLRDVFNPRPE